MAKIVWIASYPRSGNTWIRFLLANLLYKPVEYSDEIEELIPNIHLGIRADQLHRRAITLIKTHWGHVPELPLREDTIGVIYVLRNPIDVLASSIRHYVLKSDESIPRDTVEQRLQKLRAWIDHYIALGGREQCIRNRSGTWEENVVSWTTSTLPYPRLVLNYERLREDPALAATTICRFLNVQRTQEQCAAAIARSSFDSLCAMQEREILACQPGIFYESRYADGYLKGARFIGRGNIDPERLALSEGQIRAAHERFGAAMARFGYLPEQHKPAA